MTQTSSPIQPAPEFFACSPKHSSPQASPTLSANAPKPHEMGCFVKISRQLHGKQPGTTATHALHTPDPLPPNVGGGMRRATLILSFTAWFWAPCLQTPKPRSSQRLSTDCFHHINRRRQHFAAETVRSLRATVRVDPRPDRPLHFRVIPTGPRRFMYLHLTRSGSASFSPEKERNKQ